MMQRVARFCPPRRVAAASIGRSASTKGNPESQLSNTSSVASPSTSSAASPATPSADQGNASLATTAHRVYSLGERDPELRAPVRISGLFTVSEVEDVRNRSVDFAKIDELETDAVESMREPQNALLRLDEEEKWKQRLMFDYKVIKTPKHLTWAQLGREIECLECVFDLDDERPEECFTLTFYFVDKHTGVRDVVWKQQNNVAESSAFQDLLAAVGACMGRADVHRTIRFDNGAGQYREISIRKNSEFTSEIVIGFRPAVTYDLYSRVDETMAWEKSLEETGIGGWGFHPGLMDAEYRDLDEPVGTYKLTISAHALAVVVLKAIDRLITQPLTRFYRPSQIARHAKNSNKEDLGIYNAIAAWLGADEQKFRHWTPIEAIQEFWLGQDAPFTLIVIINKLREMAYLKKENPEFRSWLSVRRHEAMTAMRNIRAKMLGAGASPLFTPLSYNATVNQLIPKGQRRKLNTTVSVAGVIGMPDETRRLDELKRIAESGKLLSESSDPPPPQATIGPGKGSLHSPSGGGGDGARSGGGGDGVGGPG